MGHAPTQQSPHDTAHYYHNDGNGPALDLPVIRSRTERRSTDTHKNRAG